jgi:hypothetical protein
LALPFGAIDGGDDDDDSGSASFTSGTAAVNDGDGAAAAAIARCKVQQSAKTMNVRMSGIGTTHNNCLSKLSIQFAAVGLRLVDCTSSSVCGKSDFFWQI